MKTNFWIYSDYKEQHSTAASLKIFGAEIFKESKIIQDLDTLKSLNHEINTLKSHPKDTSIADFFFEYLVDCVRILIFFENYMKAELIVKGFCVHVINKEHTGFKELAKTQYLRPIQLKEIANIENYYIDIPNKIINHNALKGTTIGINVLLNSEDYLMNYAFDKDILVFIRGLNRYRNRLHLYNEVDFYISSEFISMLEICNQFVDEVVNETMQ